MLNPRLLLVGLLAACSLSCSSTTGPDATGALRVTPRPPELVLENLGARTLYFRAFEANTAALSLWGPCDDPERCPHVSPGQERRLSYEGVSGYHPGAEVALVYWWHLEPKAGGGFRADSIRVEAVHF